MSEYICKVCVGEIPCVFDDGLADAVSKDIASTLRCPHHRQNPKWQISKEVSK